MTIRELYDSIGADYDDVKRRWGLEKIIGKYAKKFPEDTGFSRLMEAWERQDDKGIFEASHDMKGYYGNMGMKRLEASAVIITETYRKKGEENWTPEDYARWEEQKEAANIPMVIETLKADYEHTLAQIRAFAEQ